MAQVSITIQIDQNLKNEAEAVFAKSRDTFSTAIDTILRLGLADKTIALRLAQGREAVSLAFKAVQEQAIIDGTDKIIMDEIDAIIAESRQEKKTAQ